MTSLLQKIDNMLNIYRQKKPKFHLSKLNQILVVILWEFGSLVDFSHPSAAQVHYLLLMLLVQFFSSFFSLFSMFIRHFLKSYRHYANQLTSIKILYHTCHGCLTHITYPFTSGFQTVPICVVTELG